MDRASVDESMNLIHTLDHAKDHNTAMTQRLSVSLPDELWARSKAQRPDITSTSELVQTALEEWTRPPDAAGFSLARPASAEEGFTKAKEQLAVFARSEFEKGYQAAVELVPALHWWDVQSLAVRHHFDIKKWVSAYTDSYVAGEIGQIPKEIAVDGDLIRPFLDAFGNLVSPFGDNLWGPSIPYLRGAAKAFEELWSTVNHGDTPEPAASDGHEGEGALGE